MSTVFPVRSAWYPLAATAAGLLLYLVAPILTPFLLSAVLAYIRLPPVCGTLFGFNYVLRALPASAGLLKTLLHRRSHYVDSDLYRS